MWLPRDAKDNRGGGAVTKETLQGSPPRSVVGSGRFRVTTPGGGGGGGGGGGSPAGGASPPTGRSSTMTVCSKPGEEFDQTSPSRDTLSPFNSSKSIRLSSPICGYMGHVPGKDARNVHGKTWSAVVNDQGSPYTAQAPKPGTRSSAAKGDGRAGSIKEGRSVVVPPCAGYAGYTPGMRSRFGQPWRETVVSLVEGAKSGRQWKDSGGTVVRVKLGRNSARDARTAVPAEHFHRRTMRAL